MTLYSRLTAFKKPSKVNVLSPSARESQLEATSLNRRRQLRRSETIHSNDVRSSMLYFQSVLPCCFQIVEHTGATNCFIARLSCRLAERLFLGFLGMFTLGSSLLLTLPLSISLLILSFHSQIPSVALRKKESGYFSKTAIPRFFSSRRWLPAQW